MSFGVTPEGLSIKRLQDIKDEIEASLKSSFGNNINLNAESSFGQIVGLFAERESLIWELLEDVYNSQFPASSEGINLDLVASLNGITRLSAINSSVTLKLLGDIGTIIPTGSQVSKLGDELTIFETTEIGTIDSGSDEIQNISFSNIPDSGEFKLTYNSVETSALPSSSVASDVENALNSLPDLSSVVVTGDFSVGFLISFQGADGKKNHELLSVTLNTLQEGLNVVVATAENVNDGYAPRALVRATCTQVGPIEALAGSLSIIESPITGWSSVTNDLDADLGRLEETDVELKLRREQTLQVAGAGTVDAIRSRLLNIDTVTAVIVFENNTNVVDVDGRPPHSYEVVVQGGDNQVLLDEIWESKPAGIETVGNTSGTITDSQGFTKIVKYSRPTELAIYLELDLTVDGSFPANGATVIENALIAWGDGLGIGENVIVYPKLVSQLCAVQGVTDVTVRIGTASSPTLDDNIIVAPNEISTWDSSRITIGVI